MNFFFCNIKYIVHVMPDISTQLLRWKEYKSREKKYFFPKENHRVKEGGLPSGVSGNLRSKREGETPSRKCCVILGHKMLYYLMINPFFFYMYMTCQFIYIYSFFYENLLFGHIRIKHYIERETTLTGWAHRSCGRIYIPVRVGFEIIGGKILLSKPLDRLKVYSII